MNLTQEKTCRLSSRDRYDILTFAIEAADDNGFVNSFVFERAMYCYAAIMLVEEEQKDEIRSKVIENIIDAWDYLVQNDIIQEIREQYAEELDQLATEGEIWLDEYDAYAVSARGILSLVEQFSGDIISNAASTLRTTAEETGVKDVLDIAENWGMNREILKGAPQTKEITDKESLFAE